MCHGCANVLSRRISYRLNTTANEFIQPSPSFSLRPQLSKYSPYRQPQRQSPKPSSLQEEQGFAGGGGITWPEYRAAHMDLPVQEALRRFKALKRGQNPNTMTGGMRM